MPAVLIGLLGVLATLQYRWLGKVSEAEREQLSRSLTQRARDFAEAFDRDLTRLYLAVQVPREADALSNWTAFAASYDAWRQAARHPDVVRGLYLAERAGDALTLRRYDGTARAFVPGPLTDWPAHLEPLRRQLSSAPEGPALPGSATAVLRGVGGGSPSPSTGVTVVALSQSAVASEIPALVVPLVSPPQARMVAPSATTAGVPPPPFRWLEAPRSSVIVDLDERTLTAVILPALADAHFPGAPDDGYRLAVSTSAGAVKFARGTAGGAGIDASHADVSTALFSLRFDLAPEASGRTSDRTISRAAPPGGEVEHRYSVFFSTAARQAGPPGTRARAPASRAGWTLSVQHRAGSLDAAVTQVRRRNLWISFGMLAVLAAGLLLVVRNARRAEQLAARQMDFLATVSHELRTPLAVIRSAAQNLSAGVIADAQQAQRYGTLIEHEGRRLTDMVEQVLDYAGLEGQRTVRAPRPVDVAAVVEEAAAACRPACEAAGCRLEVDLGHPDQPVPPVMGDEAALGRVVSNLMTNAAKHGADGRWIGVKVSCCTVDRGQEVHITVSDRGRGIDASEVSHIFEPFRRGRHAVDRQVHGNGLGLSLVKRIVDAHGGRVAVTSAPGQGATFAVYLPAASAGRAASGAGEAAAT